MPHKPIGFVERNIERFLLAAAGAFVVVMLAAYGVRTPNRILYEGRQLRPGELAPAILHSARQLQEAVEDATAEQADIPAHHQILQRRQAAGILCTATESDTPLPASLPRCVNFGPPIPQLEPLDPERDIVLVTQHAPTPPLLSSGRSVLRDAADAPDSSAGVVAAGAEGSAAGTALSWVSVGGYFDVQAQQQALRDAGYSRFRDAVWIVGTQVERQQLLADGGYSDWRLVHDDAARRAPAIPDPVFDPHNGLVLNRSDLDETLKQLRHSQLRRIQPPFRPVRAGADWQLPLSDAALTDPPGDGLLTEPGTGRAAVWLHDQSVEPGRTYRYRLRVNLWNCYVGRPRLLKRAAQAERSVLLGRWSEPSAPISVAPDRYFFVCGAQPRQVTVTVEVWKWHGGDWVSRRFRVGVGDLIGGVCDVKLGRGPDQDPDAQRIDFGTRAVVLDLSFDEPLSVRQPALKAGPFTYRDTRSAVAAIFDPLCGQLQQRWAAIDRYDPLRRMLKHP